MLADVVNFGFIIEGKGEAVAQRQSVSIIIPQTEFENLFLAAAGSLAGKRGLQDDILAPEHPETIRNAKGWLSDNMVSGRAYSPTLDQAAFAASMELAAARRCRSFNRLYREIERLCSEAIKSEAP